MQLSIFGTRPLQPLAADFAASADQASALADTLDRVGGSLDDTRADVAQASAPSSIASPELGALRDANDTSGTAPPLRILVLLLLAWLLVPAAGGLLMGLALLRPPRAVAPSA